MGTELVDQIHFFRSFTKCNYQSIHLLIFGNYLFLCWTLTLRDYLLGFRRQAF